MATRRPKSERPPLVAATYFIGELMWDVIPFKGYVGHRIHKRRNKRRPLRKAPEGARIRQLTKSESKALAKQNYVAQKVPGAPRLFWRSNKFLLDNWKLFGGILLIYAVMQIIGVRGLGTGFNLNQAKSSLESIFNPNIGVDIAAFGLLVGSSASAPSEAASTFQTVLIVVMSLVLIWALRQRYADVKITIRDAFYKSMYPFITFVITLFFVALQCLPLLLGSWLFSRIFTLGIAVTPIEKIIWISVFLVGAGLTMYYLSSSIFAFYIVTLPDMTPRRALRAARNLVKYRRFMIIRKVLFLPLALLLMAAVIFIPMIVFITPVAQVVFLLGTFAALGIMHSYLYALYRELMS